MPTGKRVVLHVGVPKSGTSFLQAGLREHRNLLRERGVLNAADQTASAYHAALEIRGQEAQWGHRPGAFDGTWSRLCERARAFEGTTVISHELLAPATPAQVARARAELHGIELHVVVTARDLARQLPAAWQQGIKHGGRVGFADFLERTLDPDRSHPKAQSFWARQDLGDVLSRWGDALPPEQVHVVVNPGPGADARVLWDRFLSVLGVHADQIPMPGDGFNSSLGTTQVELLRRVNNVVRPADQDGFYNRMVNGYLVRRLREHDSPRASTPPERLPVVRAICEDWVTRIEKAGYHVVGALDELLPRDLNEPTVDPDAVPTDEALDAAAATITELLHEVDRLRERLRSRPVVTRPAPAPPPPLPKRLAARARRTLGH